MWLPPAEAARERQTLTALTGAESHRLHAPLLQLLRREKYQRTPIWTGVAWDRKEEYFSVFLKNGKMFTMPWKSQVSKLIQNFLYSYVEKIGKFVWEISRKTLQQQIFVRAICIPRPGVRVGVKVSGGKGEGVGLREWRGAEARQREFVYAE